MAFALDAFNAIADERKEAEAGGAPAAAENEVVFSAATVTGTSTGLSGEYRARLPQRALGTTAATQQSAPRAFQPTSQPGDERSRPRGHHTCATPGGILGMGTRGSTSGAWTPSDTCRRSSWRCDSDRQ